MRGTLALAIAALAGWLTGAAGPGPRAAPASEAPLANRLGAEASPFLREHASDPIAWQPHDAEAFRAAARLDRPLFVSVGYATCSGCLRMSEESFPDPAVAAALNAGFVPVLVDRDATPERADAYARMAAGMGAAVGYPLHLFLLPDGSPFHVASYLPRHDRPGAPGILTVLGSVTRALGAGREALAQRGSALREAVAREVAIATPPAGAGPGAPALVRAARAQRDGVDPEWGGRLRRPKRPVEPSVPLLLRYQRRTGDAEARSIALRGLEQMVGAPIRSADGGFHEAAAARDWSEPRADQRLADNARLAIAYLEAWQVSGDDSLRDVARGIVDFLLEALAAPNGGFVTVRSGERVDPQQPAAANGLALSALARVGFAVDAPRTVDAARSTARFLLDELRSADGLVAFAAGGRRGPPATLTDHALVIAGLLDLLEADADVGWLAEALALQAEQEARFAHPEGGYYLTQAPPAPGLPRPRHARDGVLPSGQGVAALNLLRFHALTGDEAYRARADALLAAFADALRRDPRGHASLAVALDARLDGLHEIALVLAPGDGDSALLAPLRRAYAPNRVLVIVEGEPPTPLAERARLLVGKRALAGESTAFVCRDHVCAAPARDASTLERQLKRFTPLEG
jgi:uncharacterized protein YyaL (SSP411 family)